VDIYVVYNPGSSHGVNLAAEQVASCTGASYLPFWALERALDARAIIIVENPDLLPRSVKERWEQITKRARIVYYLIAEGRIRFVPHGAELVVPSRWIAERNGLSARVVPHYVEDFFFYRGEEKRLDLFFPVDLPEPVVYRKGADIFVEVARRLGPWVATTWRESPVGLVAQPRSRRELAELFKASKIVLYPSRAEGFGLPVLEALASGAVPVCSDAPAHSELCTVRVPATYMGEVNVVGDYHVDWYESCWEDYLHAVASLLASDLGDLVAKGVEKAREYRKDAVCQAWREVVA
jgi:glycosyltransferase involved in cell wall biosynthesis